MSKIFTYQEQDHTIGNLIRAELLKSDKVSFAGYKNTHPLKREIQIQVLTTPDTTPEIELEEARVRSYNEIKQLRKEFETASAVV